VEIGFREFLIPAFLWALYLVVALIRACMNSATRESGQAAARSESFGVKDQGPLH